MFESFGASGVGLGDCGHIEIVGIHTTQSFILWSTHDVRVTESEMEGGMDCDGNWSVVRMEGAASIQFDHNYLHRLREEAGCRVQALLTAFVIDDTIIEYNTFDVTDGVRPQFGVLLLKDSPVNVQVRYNHAIGQTIRGSNQNRDGRTGRNVEIFGNVVEGGSIQSWVLIEDTNIHHNTIIDGSLLGDGTFSPRLTMRNNLVAETSMNVRLTRNYWPPTGFDIDYNVYDADAIYQGNWFASSGRIEVNELAAWASAIQAAGCDGCEANSQEADCTFEARADTSYHVASGACLTASDDGSEVGAYALTDCVGRTCGAPSRPSGDAGCRWRMGA